MALPLTVEKPRTRDSSGQFSGAGVLTAALIRQAYGRRAAPPTTLLDALRGLERRLIEFKDRYEREPAEKRASFVKKAGLVTAAAGVAALPAALPLLKIQARSKFPKLGNPKTAGGDFVNDYITTSQRAMNSGLHGKLIGKRVAGKVAAARTGDAKFQADHYARFRASPREALKHWQWEVGEHQKHNLLHPKAPRKPAPLATVAARQKVYGQTVSSVQKEITGRIANQGLNEVDAIRATTKNPKRQDHFKMLASNKAGVVRKIYGPQAQIAPAVIAGGLAVAAAGKVKQDEERRKRLATLN